MSGLPIDVHLAWTSLPAMGRGLLINILLTFITLGIGLFTSLLVTLARMSKNRVMSGLAGVYVVFFRGAPLLILLYLVYYGFGQIAGVREGPLWLIFGSAFSCAIIGLVLNHTAFMVEVVRGALEAVPAGLIEASKALGITPRQTFLRIRLPLAMRYGLKAYQNEVVMFAKGTAVVSTITVNDLTSVANGIFETTYDPFTPILTAAALYWIFVNTIRIGFARIDRYLNSHLIADEKQRREGGVRSNVASAMRSSSVAAETKAPVVRERAA
jgi:arginine/ornithine transport system permease protein